MSDTTIAKDIDKAYLDDSLTDARTEVSKARSRQVSFLVSDAATAGTAVTETWRYMQWAGRVTSVRMTAPIAVTASDTLFATITLYKSTAGGSHTAIATMTTKTSGSGGTGNMTAGVGYLLTLTATAGDFAAGDSLSIAITKASTGTALTAATSYFDVTAIVEDI